MGLGSRPLRERTGGRGGEPVDGRTRPAVVHVGAALWLATAAAAAQAPPSQASSASSGGAAAMPPVADFFRLPSMSDPVLSPSGRYVAAVQQIQGRASLVLIELAEGSVKAKGLARNDVSDVVRPLWVNDERIVFGLVDLVRPGYEREPSVLMATHRDGRSAPYILNGAAGRSLHSTLGHGGNELIVQRTIRNTSWQIVGTELYRLNAQTGESRIMVTGAPGPVYRWLLDATGRPMVVQTQSRGETEIHYRRPGTETWERLFRRTTWGRTPEPGGVVDAVGLGADHQLFVTAWDERDGDRQVLAAVDLRQPEAAPKVLLSTPGYDVQGSLVYGPGQRVVGIRYVTDAAGTHWFDPTLRAIQAEIDRRLPDTVNRIDCGRCDNPQNVLVTAHSDRQPSMFLVWRVGEAQLIPIGRERPWLDPKRMATRSLQRVAARDGLELPVHVTRPAEGRGPWPTIVLVHGGPWLRGGDWRWDAASQFLASRGYLVLEPEFRGSAGYGRRHLMAGFKQWGAAMQDDLADTLAWGVMQGLADSKRACIMGGSYGGYAALMGLVRQHELWRCAVEWMGVTDIELMANHAWTDLSDDWLQHGLPEWVGDLKRDAAKLREVSPLHQAARIRRPLLMAHGYLDVRVPADHGTKLRDALKPHNPDVEFVMYGDEGHSWRRDANEIDFWTRVDAFLRRHLAP